MRHLSVIALSDLVECDIDEAKELAKKCALENEQPYVIVELVVLGTVKPVLEPVVFEWNHPTSKPPEPSKRERRSRVVEPPSEVAVPPVVMVDLAENPPPITIGEDGRAQVKAEPKAVIDDYNPFEDIEETRSEIVTVDPKAGTYSKGDWVCPNCKKTCFASQAKCVCGQMRPGIQLGPKNSHTDAAAILSHRCGNNDTKCPRCEKATIAALVGDFVVKICPDNECKVSPESAQTYNMLFGDPLASESLDAPAAEPIPSESLDAPEGSQVRNEPPVPPTEQQAIPGEEGIETSKVLIEMAVDLPDPEWEFQKLEEDPELMKALNTALSESGYGDKLRHPACVAILGQVRVLGSLKELTRAEGALCHRWLNFAGPGHLAELAKLVKPGTVTV